MAIAAVEKAFSVLEYLALEAHSVSLAETAEACSLPRPSAFRILGTLQGLGYVSRLPGCRRYSLGPRTSLLSASDPYSQIKRVARPLLKKLHEQFDETVNLGVLSDARVLYLDFIETSQPLRMIVSPGQSDPYYCTALGRAIVSCLPERELDRLVEGTSLERVTPRTVATKTQLRARLRAARELGYAEEIEESVEGVGCLATSLQAIGFPGFAISLALPLQRLRTNNKKKIIAALRSLSNP